MERKLAYVTKVTDLQPIPNADRIEVATVRGWKVVVRKGEFEIGDKCIYFEIDSILPFEPWSEFLRNKDKPIRLKTIRLKKQLSQGLALPLIALGIKDNIELDTDLTDELNIKKYIAEIPACLSGIAKGSFPSFIPKTDEERCQNLVEEIMSMQGRNVYVTEKLDGSSGTFFSYQGEFGVCSRNLELKDSEKNTFWKMAYKYDLEKVLSDNPGLSIQGEVIGNGIQKNPYKIDGHEMKVFTIYDILNNKRLSIHELVYFCEKNDLDTVPIINPNIKLEGSIEDLLCMAEGESRLYKTEREGLVFRALDDPTISFKAISNRYLL